MAKTLAPTKGNLMMAKNTLRLSKQGYEMLDKKRNILIREMTVSYTHLTLPTIA